MSGKMCGLVKKNIIEKDLKKFSKLVKKPKFVCKKCGLVSNDKDVLCKPVELED